jgi:hypothetical protein
MVVNRCIAGLLVLVASSAQANEADDTIRRLVGEAHAYAEARSPAGLSRTLFEIAKALPNASDDGLAAVNELSRYLDSTDVTPGQDAAPTAAPTPATPLPPPIESQSAEPSEPTVRESGVEAQQPPPIPALASPASPAPALPAPATPTPVSPALAPPTPALPTLALPAPAPPAPVSPAPASPVPAPAPSTPAPSAPVLPAAAAVPQASPALLDLLHRQGTAALGNGDISGARRFFQRGAEAGCASCAEGMAQTFDAEQLSRIGAIGIRPDPAQAEAWRARARQLTPSKKP